METSVDLGAAIPRWMGLEALVGVEGTDPIHVLLVELLAGHADQVPLVSGGYCQALAISLRKAVALLHLLSLDCLYGHIEAQQTFLAQPWILQ